MPIGTPTAEDRAFMRFAFEQAQIGYGEGGVPVGAVMVEEGRIIARGRNRRVQGAIVKSGVRRVIHAAALLSSMSSIPSLNLTPSMTLARWRKPRSRRQDFSAQVPIL